MSAPPFTNFERLVAAGMDADDVGEIAKDAVMIYDVNRKPKGAHSGAVGSAGWEIYRHLADDLDHFTAYRPFTTEALAAELKRSRGVIGAAINRLIEHGFVEKRRIGRGFEFRLLIPSQALIEHCADCLTAAPGMIGHECSLPLALQAADILGLQTG
jgi:hypothetical protein